MRHRVKKSFFNRDTKHRQAMLKNGLRNLVLNGELVTTAAKAKEYKRLADKLITQALKDTVQARRQLHEFFGKRDVVNSLVDRIAPLFKDRISGFTRITKEGIRRGDNTEMVKLALVVKPENLGSLKNPDQAQSAKAPAKAAAKAKSSAKSSKPAKDKVEAKTKAPAKVTAPARTSAKAQVEAPKKVNAKVVKNTAAKKSSNAK